MKWAFFLALAVLVQLRDVSTALAAAALCDPEEQVVFTCETANKKIVSLCASSDLTATSGYMQYRFGTAGMDPELVYPAEREHPKSHFMSGTLMYSGGGGAYLKFNNDGHSYTVFTGIGKGWEKEGVVVKKSGAQVAYLPCEGPWTSEIGPELFEKAELPGDTEDFEIP